MSPAKPRDSKTPPPASDDEAVPQKTSDTTGLDLSGPVIEANTFHGDADLIREMADQADEIVGTVLADRYHIIAPLGQGGMGAVYRAEHVHMKKLVALKILHPSMSLNPEVVARFEREAVAAGRLQHPGVVAATDFGRLADGAFYLALEFVDGKSLSEILSESAPLDAERALGITYQITSALSVAHQEGIVHRDLKPDNVMLVRTDDDEDFVKVLDFGIAKMHVEGEGQEGLTRAGLVFGTPEYMSPEQAMGHDADARSDVYGVGMMLYEMLCGTSPFRGDDLTAMLTAQITQPPPPLPDTVPPALAQLVYRLLEKEPAKRPRNASELSEELIEAIEKLAYRMPSPRTSAGTKLEQRRSSIDRRELSDPSTQRRRASDAPQGRFTLSPISIGKRHIPLWFPLVALLAGGAIGAVAMLTNEETAAPIKEKMVVQEAPEVVDAEAQLLTDARLGDRDAVAELRKLASLKKKELEQAGKEMSADDMMAQVARFMALGRGYSAIKHGPAAIEMYEEAVKLDPHEAQDEELLTDVRMALGAQDAVEAGLDFALQYLGAHGADLIYDVYLDNLGEVGMTPVVARAMKLVNGSEILEHATPALSVALRLQKAKYCAEYREIIPDAAQHADDRSVLKLRALRARRGCGTYGNKDCFVCLRHDAVPLDAAVERAETHPSPTFLTPEEVKKEAE